MNQLKWRAKKKRSKLEQVLDIPHEQVARKSSSIPSARRWAKRPFQPGLSGSQVKPGRSCGPPKKAGRTSGRSCLLIRNDDCKGSGTESSDQCEGRETATQQHQRLRFWYGHLPPLAGNTIHRYMRITTLIWPQAIKGDQFCASPTQCCQIVETPRGIVVPIFHKKVGYWSNDWA